MSKLTDRLLARLAEIRISIESLPTDGLEAILQENKCLIEKNRLLEADAIEYEERFRRLAAMLASATGKPESYFKALPTEELEGWEGKYFITCTFDLSSEKRQEFVSKYGLDPYLWYQRWLKNEVPDTGWNSSISFEAAMFGPEGEENVS